MIRDWRDFLNIRDKGLAGYLLNNRLKGQAGLTGIGGDSPSSSSWGLAEIQDWKRLGLGV